MSAESTELAGIGLVLSKLVDATREATQMVDEHWKRLHARADDFDALRERLAAAELQRDYVCRQVSDLTQLLMDDFRDATTPGEDSVRAAIRVLREQKSLLAAAEKERDEARANNRKKLCVYCGYAAEHDDPEKCRDLIVEHVIACPKNLFRVEADRLGEELVAVAKDCDDALVLLGEADRAREAAEAENARLREALRRIADVADGPAYGVAKDALREKG